MIRGERITLRLVREKDLDTLFELLADIENRGDYYPIHLQAEPQFRQRFQETGFWGDDRGTMLITTREGRILGKIDYFRAQLYFNALEIAYILHDQASRGQGYMSEALGLFTRFLFDTRHVNRLQLTVIVGNAASRRVAIKNGFQSEGILRGAVFQKGRHVDLEMFSLLRSDIDRD